MASKLTKNLGPPTSTLHVANLPDDFTHAEVKVRAVVGSLCGVNMPNCPINTKHLFSCFQLFVGYVHRQRFHCERVQGMWSWWEHGETYLKITSGDFFGQFFPIKKYRLIENHENNLLQYRQGSFDYGEP